MQQHTNYEINGTYPNVNDENIGRQIAGIRWATAKCDYCEIVKKELK